MAWIFCYLTVGALYASVSIYGFVVDPAHPEEARAIAEILRDNFILRITVFAFFTFGWLFFLAWLLIKTIRDELN